MRALALGIAMTLASSASAQSLVDVDDDLARWTREVSTISEPVGAVHIDADGTVYAAARKGRNIWVRHPAQ